MENEQALVGLIMGSHSDWETMQKAAEILSALAIPHEIKVVSAHRTPDLMFKYASSAVDRGLEVIIAGAGGAAHLPGMVAAKTPLPVLGVPVKSRALNGMDSLLSIAQMPAGTPSQRLQSVMPVRPMPVCWPRPSWVLNTHRFVVHWRSLEVHVPKAY